MGLTGSFRRIFIDNVNEDITMCAAALDDMFRRFGKPEFVRTKV